MCSKRSGFVLVREEWPLGGVDAQRQDSTCNGFGLIENQ